MHGKIKFIAQPSSTPTELMTPSCLPPKAINHVQQIIGTLLYYAISVNPTMLVALDSIAAQ